MLNFLTMCRRRCWTSSRHFEDTLNALVLLIFRFFSPIKIQIKFQFYIQKSMRSAFLWVLTAQHQKQCICLFRWRFGLKKKKTKICNFLMTKPFCFCFSVNFERNISKNLRCALPVDYLLVSLPSNGIAKECNTRSYDDWRPLWILYLTIHHLYVPQNNIRSLITRKSINTLKMKHKNVHQHNNEFYNIQKPKMMWSIKRVRFMATYTSVTMDFI